jgi:hypothetical protein
VVRELVKQKCREEVAYHWDTQRPAGEESGGEDHDDEDDPKGDETLQLCQLDSRLFAIVSSSTYLLGDMLLFNAGCHSGKWVDSSRGVSGEDLTGGGLQQCLDGIDNHGDGCQT